MGAMMRTIAKGVSGMQMDRRLKLAAAALAAFLGAPVLAAPPTVTPSPGYDARLQESRKAMTTTSDQSSTPANAPVTPPHTQRRKHAHR